MSDNVTVQEVVNAVTNQQISNQIIVSSSGFQGSISTVQQNSNIINVQPNLNQVIVSSTGIQGAPGNFVYIYDIDGGTPTSIYGGNIIINAGGV
jgi:hypothetical protein